MSRIAVDMDEVLYAWERTARYLLREVRGLEGLKEVSTAWDTIPNTVGPEHWDWLWSEGIRLGLYRYGHTVKGAQLGVRALKALGHELVVVSHRPAEAIQDTLAWLDLFFGREDPYPWSGIHLLTNGEDKTNVDWDLLIDDKPDNISSALHAGRWGILFAHPWNREAYFSHRDCHVAPDWREITRYVRSAIPV